MLIDLEYGDPVSSGTLTNGPTVLRSSPGPDMSTLLLTYSSPKKHLQFQVQGEVTEKAKAVMQTFR